MEAQQQLMKHIYIIGPAANPHFPTVSTLLAAVVYAAFVQERENDDFAPCLQRLESSTRACFKPSKAICIEFVRLSMLPGGADTNFIGSFRVGAGVSGPESCLSIVNGAGIEWNKNLEWLSPLS